MTEVNLRPLTMFERDIPVQFPSSRTLPTPPTSGKVQLREPHTPSMAFYVQPLSERSPTAYSYELLSTKIKTTEQSLIMVKTTALTEEKPPEDTPAMPIPPKPPHSAACADTATIIAPHTTAATTTPEYEQEPRQQAFNSAHTHDLLTSHPQNNPIGDNRAIKVTQPPHVAPWPQRQSVDTLQTVTTTSVATMARQRGQKRDFNRSASQAWHHESKEPEQHKRPSPSHTGTQRPLNMTNPRSQKCMLLTSNSQKNTITAEEERRAVTTPNAQVACDLRQRWEHLREFHASNSLWPMDIPMQGIEGDSPLIRTMFYPLSEATRILTYAWNGHGDATSGTDGSHNPVTERLPCLAQSRWNSRADAGWTNSPPLANLLRRTRRPSAQATTRPSLETTQNLQQPSPPQWQWENMRAFHSSKLLWPTKERTSQTQVDGGSPLIWTTLLPHQTDVRLQTYAWNGYLANYMPWKLDPATDRPPIISYARWNIRRSTPTLAMANPLPGFNPTHQATLENPTRQPSCEPQQYKKFSTPVPSVKAQFNQQPVPNLQSYGWTRTQTPGPTWPVPHLTTPAPAPRPPPSASTRNNSVLLAIMIYILLFQHSSNTKSETQLHESPATRQCSYSQLRPATAVKTRKSCVRRTMAIIQRLWDTAWDLTTHRNVESVSLGSASHNLDEWKLLSISLHRISSVQTALASTVL